MAIKKRLTREQSKVLTREKILNAAIKAFARQGFAGASVDEIAEAAGFSRGAFYSNFESKDDLFLQLVEDQLRFLTDDAHAIISGAASKEETLNRLRNFYMMPRSRDKDAFLLVTEAQLHAARNTRFRAKLAALFRKIHDELTASIEYLYQQTDIKNSAPADLLAFVALASSQGLVLFSIMDSKSYPDKMVSRGQELIFDRMLHL